MVSNNPHNCFADTIRRNNDRHKFVLLGSAATLDRLLADCRAVKLPKISHDLSSIDAHLHAYSKMLLGMAPAMPVTGNSVMPHLIWKHMLAAIARAKVSLTTVTAAQLQSIAPDFMLPELPSWLHVRKLAGQVNCPVQLLSMWTCLWRDALELDGASDAVFQNAAGILVVLKKYISEHGLPPSPQELMREYLTLPEVRAGKVVDEEEPVAPKRRRRKACLSEDAEAKGDDALRSQSTSGCPPVPAAAAAAPVPGQRPRKRRQPPPESASRSSAEPAAHPAAKRTARTRQVAKPAGKLATATGKTMAKARASASAARTGARRPQFVARSHKAALIWSGCHHTADD